MTAKQMLIHLKQSSKMMNLENTKLLIKEKYIEKAIAFLYTDKPISRGIEIPEFRAMVTIPKEAFYASFESV